MKFHFLALAFILALWNFEAPARAHPMGNFSISHYSRLKVQGSGIEILYKLDFAEIPSVSELNEVKAAGQQSYLQKKSAELRDGLTLKVDGRPVNLEVARRDLQIVPGAAQLKTLRMAFVLTTQLPSSNDVVRRVEYSDNNYSQRTGWKEIVVVAAPGLRLQNSDASSREISQALTSYPADAVTPQQTTAKFEIVPAGSAPSVASSEVSQAGQSTPTGERTPADGSTATPQDSFTQTIAQEKLTPGVMLLGLLIAFGFGALHALSPGHGKALVAAYLVGSRGTPKHALTLGLVVTITHTLGVFALGLVTLFASKYILPERLYPILGTVSGLAVFGVGVWLLASRMQNLSGGHHHAHDHDHHDHHHNHDHEHHDHEHHDHEHGHTHDHGFGAHTHAVPEGPVTAKTLLALGISGGIVPCPSALVVLLSAIALHRLVYGLALISAFSVGLAAVLIAIGLLVVSARDRLKRFDRFPISGKLLRYLPVGSAAAITVIGVMLVMRALAQGNL